jgi:uncharacterized protein (TIGR03083 family)
MHDPAAAIIDIWDRLITVAKGLDGDDWSLPTPCRDWDVHDLLAHCSGVQVALDGGADVPIPEGWTPPEYGDPADRWAAAAVAARRAWGPEQIRTELRVAREGHAARLGRVEDWDSGVEGPAGRTTEAGLLATRCFDLWVHLQDLHVALGQTIDIGDDSEVARAAHGFVAERVPYLMAKRVTDGADASLRLVVAAPAPLDATVVVRDGRGSYDTPSEHADSTVRVAPEALTLLVSGRDGPEQWRDRGLLDWVGPVGDAFVRRARLF